MDNHEHRGLERGMSMRLILLVVPLAVSLVLVAAGPSAADHCPVKTATCWHTSGDDVGDAVITEGTVFPDVPPESPVGQAAAEVANCPDCKWFVVPRCDSNDPTSGAACRSAMAKPSFQPAQGGIVNLPTLFAANEPATMTTEPFDVLGVQVQVTATARWEWTFEDGATREFTEPGGPYPNDDVAYTYATTGTRQVSVTTYWTAEYTVNGAGPFPVPGPEISKTAGPIQVPVREARSVLVGG